jgi:hypothetical protein
MGEVNRLIISFFSHQHNTPSVPELASSSFNFPRLRPCRSQILPFYPRKFTTCFAPCSSSHWQLFLTFFPRFLPQLTREFMSSSSRFHAWLPCLVPRTRWLMFSYLTSRLLRLRIFVVSVRIIAFFPCKSTPASEIDT